jgi:tellurite methyltransferase
MQGAFLEIDWDKRYREGFYAGKHRPHRLVEKYVPLMDRRGPVIDIAMGTGRDLLLPGRLGFPVYGLERSREAIVQAGEAARENGVEIGMVLGDAAHLPFRPGSARAILVFYFLMREIMGELVRLLAPGGLLLYETFLKRQNEIDRPRNPLFLLDDGELLTYFKDLELLYYEEGIFTAGKRRRAIARYAGRKR